MFVWGVDGLVWDAVDKLGFIFRVVVNAAVVSGLSSVTYWLAASEMHGLLAPEPSSQIADMKSWISAGITISGSGRDSVFGHYSISGTTLIPRPSPCAWPSDYSRGSTRLTSLERVTTGVGSVSRSARAKPNSLGSSLRPMLLDGADSMVSLEPVRLLTDNREMPKNSGNDLRCNKCSIYSDGH